LNKSRNKTKAESKVTIRTTVNGKYYESEVEPRLLLVYYLRDELGITGPNTGCDTSNCGACTVLLEGRNVKSCTLFAVQADAQEILTIEGMSSGGKLHPLQQAFIEEHAVQCGFCTPGMIMSAYALLRRNPNPSDDEIKHGISGNLCRCTGYQNIVAAIRAASKEIPMI
jgi:aerobic carbon-monoxide dehydrogenase small subunit